MGEFENLLEEGLDALIARADQLLAEEFLSRLMDEDSNCIDALRASNWPPDALIEVAGIAVSGKSFNEERLFEDHIEGATIDMSSVDKGGYDLAIRVALHLAVCPRCRLDYEGSRNEIQEVDRDMLEFFF